MSAPVLRPTTSVVVPFLGDAGEAARLLAGLTRLELAPGDELIVVDNGPQATVPEGSGEGPIRLLRALRKRSSYHARNVGASAARGEWLLFLDADTRPSPDLIARYLEAPVPPEVGIVAGEVDSAPEQGSLAARRQRSRRHLRIEPMITGRQRPTGATANLLVRRAVWEQLGGFHEVRSGADMELCWRAQDAGWRLLYRPEARVEHVHEDSVRATLRKARFYGPGQAWLNRRYPGGAPRPPLARQLGRALAGTLVWTLTARFERAAFKAIDGLWVLSYSLGYYAGSNRVAPAPVPQDGGESAGANPAATVLALPSFGSPGDRGLLEGTTTPPPAARRILAAQRPAVIDRELLGGAEVSFVEDYSVLSRGLAVAWFALRHPGRLGRALLRRRTAPAEAPGVAALAAAARPLAAGGRAALGVRDAGGWSGATILAALVGAPSLEPLETEQGP